MALDDFLKRFYTKVFVGIYPCRDIVHAAALYLSPGGEQTDVRHSFAVSSSQTELYRFVQEAVDRSPLNYIAILADDESCGALPTCSLSKAKTMVPAVAESKTVCIEEEWMNYIGEEALYGLLQRFSDAEPDALYSPFALLHAFYGETMAGAHAVYLFLTAEAMSLAVVKERHLRFADRFAYGGGAMVPAMVEGVVDALEAYYGKPCCRGEFVEAVYIADGVGVGELLGKSLEEVLLLETEVRQADPALLAARACMKEAGYAV